MKTLFRTLFASILASFSRAIIRKYHPKIVMVTGSVGKTSTKDAVAAALSQGFKVRKSDKGFNSDFGVPFTIIGVDNPWSSIPAWLAVFSDALGLIFFPHSYPNMLVLEVGADRPGDLARILRIATPDAVVVTRLPSVPVHVEAYETPAAVREEEFSPAFALMPHSPLILSTEDEYALNLSRKLDVHTTCFGTDDAATVQIKDIQVWMEKEEAVGMEAVFKIEDREHEIKIAGALGRTQLYAPAAALATALALGLTPMVALKGLASYVSPPGRGRLFKGKMNTLLIDDTYNSSPAAAEEVLHSLEMLPRPSGARRVAILGDMLELGRYSMAEHTQLGHIAKECADIIVTVGSRAQAIGEAAIADGMQPGNVIAFNNSKDAAAAILDLLKEGDIVLIKGSQGIRLERVTKALLADPHDAEGLVRQDKEWLKR